MAIKKSELYSSLWASCDELRGGMDASQYKDYVLVLLFIKYISDKYTGKPFAPLTIPQGCSFADMVALKGNKEIGDKINKDIIVPLVNANQQLSLSDFPDFNDATKLGSGKELVERLSNLIGIFYEPALDFSKNRADGDDILGDAYEYLMRHFATESGKSKGQFYTPSEVSQVIAKVIGISLVETSPSTTVYDPTCGSGSLLLKVADEAESEVSLYGQEKDATTSGLARMNMILHGYPLAEIAQGNTLSDPQFSQHGTLKTFDFVVANPPFSDKRWSTGVDAANDPHERFKPFGTPPDKQGDFAYLLHIIRSLKSTGKGACILPHGVLFRGNAEATIRQKLIRKGYLKGIIGLPANLFYGTGIPACILVLDKEGAHARKGIFMIDASNGFMKDGNKNRLRSRDIHKIVDVFTKGITVTGYSRLVPVEEIETKNDFNLNLPRYIDNRTAEDFQDIEAHLKGGIPQADVDSLENYWQVCPGLKQHLFSPLRPGYLTLTTGIAELKSTIYHHPEFATLISRMETHFSRWRQRMSQDLRETGIGDRPKALIHAVAEDLLLHYEGQPLMDAYAVYQHLLDYWAETMQDDCYLISIDGWKAATYRLLEKTKAGREVDKGWACDLVPKSLMIARYFAKEQQQLQELQTELESVTSQRTELEEEHGGDEGAFAELEKINKAEVNRRLKTIQNDRDASEETALLQQWLEFSSREAELRKTIKETENTLDAAVYAKYPTLSEAEIQTLVVDDKWLTCLGASIHGELDRISQTLTQRVKELAERYQSSLPELTPARPFTRGQRQKPPPENGIRMDLKPGYKQTEVGVIPEDWEVKRIGEISIIKTGSTPPTADRTNYGHEYLFVSPSDLGFSKYVKNTEKKLSLKGFTISRYFPKDSILFVCIGSTIGKCGICLQRTYFKSTN